MRRDVHDGSGNLRFREDYFSCELILCKVPKVAKRVYRRQGS